MAPAQKWAWLDILEFKRNMGINYNHHCTVLLLQFAQIRATRSAKRGGTEKKVKIRCRQAAGVVHAVAGSEAADGGGGGCGAGDTASYQDWMCPLVKNVLAAVEINAYPRKSTILSYTHSNIKIFIKFPPSYAVTKLS